MQKEKIDSMFIKSLVELYRKFRNLQLSLLKLSRISKNLKADMLSLSELRPITKKSSDEYLVVDAKILSFNITFVIESN